jgi:hypothetical protein
MRRILLAFLFLFSLKNSNAQVILNELYTSPKAGLSEFFELYNTNLGAAINLDCYAMVVYWEETNGSKGFYVLDFPSKEIGPLSFFVGSAIGPSFGIQQCSQTTPNFHWSAVNGTNDASIKNYVWNGSTYTVTDLPDVEDFLTANKNAVTGGFNYAVFLFNNGSYVNGFLGGHNSTNVPSSVTAMQPLTYSTNCGPKTIDWSTVTRAENVTENTGTDKNADNGYMRQGDGKCGEWVKASSPTYNQSTGQCSNRNGEHSPGVSNNTNGQSNVSDGFTLSTQTSVCGTRIDYAVTGVKTKGNNTADEFFPFIVELYEDVNKNGILDANDLYITSTTISGVSSSFFDFPNLTTTSKYLLVFQSQNLNCLEKIVSTDVQSLTTTETNYCGSQIDVTVNQANFNVGSGFTVSIYEDKGTIGQYDPALDLPFTNPDMTPYQFTGGQIGQTRTFDIPTQHEGKPYIIVYTSGACNTLTRSGIAPVTTSLQTAQIYICGDDNGDIVTFDIQGISGNQTGALPITIELWPDNGFGAPGGSAPLMTKTQNNPIAAPTDQFVIQSFGEPLILIYRTARGCPIAERLLNQCGALPVNMGSFTAVRNRNKVALKWETLTEQNNRGFYVQRNTKGVWENRAFVFSAASGGNSNDLLTYTFNDDNNEKGVSQYRIQQVDLDGKVTFTPIRSVKGLEQANKIIVYPNPSEDGKVNVVFEEQGAKNVIVSDISGRMVRQYRNVVNNLVVDGLDPGLYLFQIIDLSTTETSVEKVIIKKR